MALGFYFSCHTGGGVLVTNHLTASMMWDRFTVVGPPDKLINQVLKGYFLSLTACLSNIPTMAVYFFF